MKRIAATLVVHLLALACAPLASADVFNMPGGLKSLSFVAIGDAGNAHDPATGGVFGGVADNYAIGKFDVTTAQYAQFLNAVAATDTYELYSPSMGTYFGSSGVSRSGSSGSYFYSVIGNGDTPIFDVSWGDAARFVNWIENGQPAGIQDLSTTENGAYLLNGATTTPALTAVVRNAGARYWIPTENEWYKAAYYDPVTDSYFKFATGSNADPNNALNPAGLNHVNYQKSGVFTDPVNILTPVGFFANSPSPFGTFDQTGLMTNWTETIPQSQLTDRVYRGGSWNSPGPNDISSSFRNSLNPHREIEYIGFRVATVPEPTSGAPAAIGLAIVSLLAWRRRTLTMNRARPI